MDRPSAADRVWNRGCDRPTPGSRIGDKALSAMIRVDGLICNGGLGHAIECLSPEELAAGIRGYEYFGLLELSAIVSRALGASESERDQLDALYYQSESDQDLVTRFEHIYATKPEDFDPI